MIYAEDIAERVRLGREALGLTQAVFAKRADVSRATIARVEAGGAGSVSFGAMTRILNAANWSLSLEKGVVAKADPDAFDIDAYLDSLFGDSR